MGVETIACRIDKDCGCEEHDIMLNHVSAIVHLEPDHTGEVFVDFGDWQEEWHFDNCIDIEAAKEKAWMRFTALSKTNQ